MRMASLPRFEHTYMKYYDSNKNTREAVCIHLPFWLVRLPSRPYPGILAIYKFVIPYPYETNPDN